MIRKFFNSLMVCVFLLLFICILDVHAENWHGVEYTIEGSTLKVTKEVPEIMEIFLVVKCGEVSVVPTRYITNEELIKGDHGPISISYTPGKAVHSIQKFDRIETPGLIYEWSVENDMVPFLHRNTKKVLITSSPNCTEYTVKLWPLIALNGGVPLAISDEFKDLCTEYLQIKSNEKLVVNTLENKFNIKILNKKIKCPFYMQKKSSFCAIEPDYAEKYKVFRVNKKSAEQEILEEIKQNEERGVVSNIDSYDDWKGIKYIVEGSTLKVVKEIPNLMEAFLVTNRLYENVSSSPKSHRELKIDKVITPDLIYEYNRNSVEKEKKVLITCAPECMDFQVKVWPLLLLYSAAPQADEIRFEEFSNEYMKKIGDFKFCNLPPRVREIEPYIVDERIICPFSNGYIGWVKPAYKDEYEKLNVEKKAIEQEILSNTVKERHLCTLAVTEGNSKSERLSTLDDFALMQKKHVSNGVVQLKGIATFENQDTLIYLEDKLKRARFQLKNLEKKKEERLEMIKIKISNAEADLDRADPESKKRIIEDLNFLLYSTDDVNNKFETACSSIEDYIFDIKVKIEEIKAEKV